MKRVKKLIIFCIIVLIYIYIEKIYYNNNLRLISKKNKNNLIDILELDFYETFEPISLREVITIHGSDSNWYDLIFKISQDEYSKNNLEYDSVNDETLYFKYKTKFENDKYLCKIRVSNDVYKEYLESDNLQMYENLKQFYRGLKLRHFFQICNFIIFLIGIIILFEK